MDPVSASPTPPAIPPTPASDEAPQRETPSHGAEELFAILAAPGPGHRPATHAPGPMTPATAQRITLALNGDHDRIAADLSDGLIHQMFAISLDLHAALAQVGRDHHAAEKIAAAITGLDHAITDLRATIYDLHTTTPAP